MIKELLDANISPYFQCNQVLSGGTLVKMDTANAGYVIPANAGDNVYGILAQDVLASGADSFKLDSVTTRAHVGDHVGVFFGGGVYLTNNFSGNIGIGQALYAGANGTFVATASGSVLAYAETTGNSVNGDKIRLKVVGF